MYKQPLCHRKCLVHLKKSLQVKYCSTVAKSKPQPHPDEKKKKTIDTKNKKQKDPDIVQYLKEHNEDLDVKSVPDKYLIKSKNAKILYLANPQTAESLANILKPHLEKSDAKVIECHPGLGLLTNHLSQMNVTDVNLHEPDPLFFKNLLNLSSSSNVKVFNNDILQVPKCITATKKLDSMLEYIEKKEWEHDCIYQLIASLNNQDFLRYILRNFSHQNGILALGRPIMYLLITPATYQKLIAGPHEPWNLYKPLAVLFQIIFHIELLSKVDRRSFVPWPTPYKKTESKGNLSEDSLYLIRIEGKKHLYQKLGKENIERVNTLQKFVTHVIGRKKQRIIPTIEQWVPGFGPHLIKVFVLFWFQTMGSRFRSSSDCSKHQRLRFVQQTDSGRNLRYILHDPTHPWI
uniref:rRNA adenine N(6)-methyltransferase n=3 Tax=Cacopsylla melanoneura TaxID=428564 RepID=A0A8D8LUX8_9HEMI